jgi:hypothetical protein
MIDISKEREAHLEKMRLLKQLNGGRDCLCEPGDPCDFHYQFGGGPCKVPRVKQ